ncbi:MAG: hypothetical protein Ct9H90mP2_12200 [Dehalococcoidia bacterium]|nr:MAG: hypothetical protein Ct9H90mP2_12200 [Dehalococcoidia bacterium]
MYILMVRLKVKEEKIQEFIEESIGDAAGSVKNEPGCRRFDIIQDSRIRLNSHSAKFMTTKMHSKHTQLTNILRYGLKIQKTFIQQKQRSLSFKPVYPTDNVKWGSARDDFSDHEYFFKLFFDGYSSTSVRKKRECSRIY